MKELVARVIEIGFLHFYVLLASYCLGDKFALGCASVVLALVQLLPNRRVR